MPFSRANLRTSQAPARLLAYLAELAPELAVGHPLRATHLRTTGDFNAPSGCRPPQAADLFNAPSGCRPPQAADLSALDPLALIGKRGFTRLGSVAGTHCDALRRAVDAIVAEGLPGTLVYAFDEVWAIGEAVREATTTSFGNAYELAADVWAWSIPPGRGRGWTAHRGVSDVLLDRATPEVINVWIALSDVTVERACMHAVPLDDDEGYPHALERTDHVGRAVALPVPAGSVLAWNANVLHWGGECLASAPGPRTSCSFSLVRPDREGRTRLPTVRLLDPQARIELVAHQIVTYGAGQPDIDPDFFAWAQATCALGATLPTSRIRNP